MEQVSRTKEQIIESLIKTYNNGACVNFMDVRDIDNLLPQEEVVQKLIDSYNTRNKIDFFVVRAIVEFLSK